MEEELEKAKIALKTKIRMELLEKMVKLEEKRKKEIQILKESIEKLEIKRVRIKCKYGWSCEKAFCTFDHKYLYTKVNVKQTKIICQLCEKTFSSKKNLEEHAGSCISSENVLNQSFSTKKRDKCNKTIKNKMSLRKHEAKDHMCKIISCSNCDKTFSDKVQLKKHEREESRIKDKNNQAKIDKDGMKSSNMKKGKLKKLSKRSKTLLVKKKVENCELDNVDSTDNNVEDEVSTSDDYTTEETDSESSETESGEMYSDTENSS